MENSNATILDMGGAMRNTFAKMANALAVCDGDQKRFGGLGDIARLFQLGEHFESHRNECGNFGNLKNVGFEKGGELNQLLMENGKRGNLQNRIMKLK